MHRKVAIIGAGMTRFGNRTDKTLMGLFKEAATRAVDHAKIGDAAISALYVSTMLAGELTNQTATASALADELCITPAAADRVENGPASGGSAVKTAYLSVAAGFADIVLVVGGEKMREVPGDKITDLIATMTHPTAEYIHGITLPSLAAMFTRLYMNKYGVERKHLSMVAVKNHDNALLNPYAHIHRKITLEGIYSSPEAEVNNPVIADPLRLFDMCPVSDGAAAVVLCDADIAKKFTEKPVIVAGVGQATDIHAVAQRPDPTTLNAVKNSSEQAFKMAKLTPAEMDFAELHDAFTILEIAESEDAGFFKKGTAHKAVEEGVTLLGGKFPINPSGGLKARGHPVGATGVAQVAELTWQLRGEAGERQVKGAKRAFCCNFGGFGNNVVSFVLRRET
jgi:acetyl-CoA C-acetyltransferase